MDKGNETDVMLARYHWREFLSAAKQLGLRVKAASFEERERADDFAEVEVWVVLEVPE